MVFVILSAYVNSLRMTAFPGAFPPSLNGFCWLALLAAIGWVLAI